ncbi:MAG: major facilitator superfamily 1 [Bradyrhizobium sp.]|nr:major facilitator superfamily 1 [Bradyrhizobium sp.]
MAAGTEASEFRAHWRISIGAFIGITFGIASLFGYATGIFMKPLEAEFGWSRSAISVGLLLSTLATAITTPLVGYIADRYDLRRIIIAATLGLALSFFLFASLWNALWVFMLLMVVKSFLSAGTSPVVYTRMINQWFDRSRGFALGLALAGNGLAGILLPVLLAPYVAQHGWRAGYIAIAVCVLVTAPLIWFNVRDRRYAARGVQIPESMPKHSAGSVRAIVRTRTFWLLMTALLVPALGMGGIGIHLIPMLTDFGLTPSQAGAIAGVLGGAVVLGRIVTGSLIDRFFAPHVAAVAYALTALGCAGLAIFGVAFAPYAAFLVGLATGAEVDIIGYTVARYFGLKHYGLIYGFMYTAFLMGASVSQLIASAVFDHMGNYVPYLWFACASLVLGALVALALPRFQDVRER